LQRRPVDQRIGGPFLFLSVTVFATAGPLPPQSDLPMMRFRGKFKYPFTLCVVTLVYTFGVNSAIADPLRISPSRLPQVARQQQPVAPTSVQAPADKVELNSNSETLPEWRFAWNYKTEDFKSNPAKAE